jgi:hypothetical protein
LGVLNQASAPCDGTDFPVSFDQFLEAFRKHGARIPTKSDGTPT